MLPQQEMIGHTGDIVADNAMGWLLFGQLRIIFRHAGWMCQVIAKQLLERVYGTVPLFDDCRMVVKSPVEESLQVGIDCCHTRAESRQVPRQPANIVRV